MRVPMGGCKPGKPFTREWALQLVEQSQEEKHEGFMVAAWYAAELMEENIRLLQERARYQWNQKVDTQGVEPAPHSSAP